LGGLLGVPAVLCGGVLALAGLRLIVDYQQQGAEMLTQVGTGRSVESAGQTLLGLCQSIFGPGPIAAALAIAGSVLVELAIGMMWWRGLRADARSSLQLAAVPVAAVLAAPHALGYELTTWLASAWLLLRYAVSIRLGYGQCHHPHRKRHRLSVGSRPGRSHAVRDWVALPDPRTIVMTPPQTTQGSSP
jgi:hypothetical protein